MKGGVGFQEDVQDRSDRGGAWGGTVLGGKRERFKTHNCRREGGGRASKLYRSLKRGGKRLEGAVLFTT